MTVSECPPPSGVEAEKARRLVVRCGLTKAEAEDLLDWLENNGLGPAELWYQHAGWAVRFEAPPGDPAPVFRVPARTASS
jgi:hypothetical protein